MKFHVVYNSCMKEKNSRISFLYTNRISYFFGTIDNSKFRSFSNIFLCVASLRLESSNFVGSSPKQTVKLRKEPALRFCGNSRP